MMLFVGACSRSSANNSPSESVSSGLDGARDFEVGATEHIVIDGSGSYFCVLRRPDDLADLRAQFNPPSGG